MIWRKYFIYIYVISMGDCFVRFYVFIFIDNWNFLLIEDENVLF